MMERNYREQFKFSKKDDEIEVNADNRDGIRKSRACIP